jgi:hypothetical protein
MKLSILALVCFSLLAVHGQGTVNFINGPGTLVSVGPLGQEALISGPVGSYYFGLLIAAPGTTQPSLFSFAGIYATNDAAFPGRLAGEFPTPTPVPGWGPGVPMSFLVAGWSSSLGHDWNQSWMSGIFAGPGDFGLSSIATGTSGGLGLPPTPGLDLFGGPTGIQTGFALLPVPEPTGGGFAAAATIVILLHRVLRGSASRVSQRRGMGPETGLPCARTRL